MLAPYTVQGHDQLIMLEVDQLCCEPALFLNIVVCVSNLKCFVHSSDTVRLSLFSM